MQPWDLVLIVILILIAFLKRITFLIHLQRLIEELAQMDQQRGVRNHQRGAGPACRLLRFFALRRGKGDDREVAGGGIAPEGRDGFTGLLEARLEIDESHEGFLAFRSRREIRRRGHRLDPVAEILQAVDQLATGQEFLVEQQRERLLHGRESGIHFLKLQKISERRHSPSVAP